MLSFATTIDNIRQRLERRNDVLTLLSKTPFWTLIDAYMQRRLTKVECMKSNYDIVRLIQVYDTKTKKFRFNDGDSEMKSQDVDEIFGLPNRGKKLPSTTTSTRPDLQFVKKYFTEVNYEYHVTEIKSTKAQEPDDDSEEENEENDDDSEEENEEEDDAAEEVKEEHDDAAEEENEENDDAAEEVNEEHGDAAEEENEEEEDAEVNEDRMMMLLNIKSSNTTSYKKTSKLKSQNTGIQRCLRKLLDQSQNTRRMKYSLQKSI
ncbi:hypothetical protein L3X38_015681 [Prunus dulcis]|uniref:Uncharacterized protein n=1 Tax=Prunus dulcis TaxID=3755 RepID=A0AAD4Z8G0_PRUDU|nr:hypothetical protein L3X38_015681 [Prunus dulcis]